MKAELLEHLAKEAGFRVCQSHDLCGESELDEIACVGEYPCGELLNKFADLVIEHLNKQAQY